MNDDMFDELMESVQEMDQIEYFKKLQSHDWYYDYSDDNRVWEKGRRESQRLQAIAQEMPIYLVMYEAMADYMLSPPEKRKGLKEPKIEDYLN